MSADRPVDAGGNGETEAALREEALRLRELRVLVDLTTALIAQSRPARDEAQRLVAAARRRILELFPDKESMYELILAPRCARLLEEIPEPTGRVLPFHAR